MKLPRSGMEALDWRFADPGKLLAFFCEESELFRSVLSKALAAEPFVARLIFYADEVTPGRRRKGAQATAFTSELLRLAVASDARACCKEAPSPGATARPSVRATCKRRRARPSCGNALAAKDFSRKFMAFYMGIENMGDLMKNEFFWLPLAAIRATLLKEVDGGCSAAFRAIMRQTFTADGSFAGGELVNLDVGPRLVFPAYAGFLADEAAIHAVFCTKGASGTRCRRERKCAMRARCVPMRAA